MLYKYFPAWSWVNHGYSESLAVEARPNFTSKSVKIITSRSHAGTVNQTAQDAFGKETTVVAAGGAGGHLDMSHFKCLQMKISCLHIFTFDININY